MATVTEVFAADNNGNLRHNINISEDLPHLAPFFSQLQAEHLAPYPVLNNTETELMMQLVIHAARETAERPQQGFEQLFRALAMQCDLVLGEHESERIIKRLLASYNPA